MPIALKAEAKADHQIHEYLAPPFEAGKRTIAEREGMVL
jgi:hypothetical protein